MASNHPRYMPSAWKVPLWTPNRPRFMPSAWMVHPIDIEPSAILVPSVEGPALDPEPSAIHAFSVDGSPSDTRTFRDSCPESGWFAPSTLNHPRYIPPAWMVHPIDTEPSAIRGYVSPISCYTSNVKTWRKMPDPLGYDEKGSCQA